MVETDRIEHEHWCVDCATEKDPPPIYAKQGALRKCYCVTRRNQREVKCFRHEDVAVRATINRSYPTYQPALDGHEVTDSIRMELGGPSEEVGNQE